MSISNLSGGNIQKVILAREIEDKPNLLIAVYPTRGLDIASTNYIYSLFRNFKKEGNSILLFL